MKKIFIRDVSPRDGLQNEDVPITTEQKVNLVHALTEAGVAAIEVTSFAHPKYVPQMSDATEVMKRINRKSGTSYHVLVPNLRGAERAIESNPDQINIVVSASDSHNQANLKKKTFETLNEYKEIKALTAKTKVKLQGAIATTFGCPFEGKVPIDRILRVLEAYLHLGVDSICFADTTGMANPIQVKETIRAIRQNFKDLEIHLHFHNTRGAGIANLFAGIEEGVIHFDASLGGIGGCPFAPGATGNICTEDVINLLNDAGIETNIDLDRLIEASKKLEKYVQHVVPSQIIKAGKTYRTYSLKPYL